MSFVCPIHGYYTPTPGVTIALCPSCSSARPCRLRRDQPRAGCAAMTDDDPITRADLTRELHYMQTQVEQHGFPGTRAVLAELERLSKENARLAVALRDNAKLLDEARADQTRRILDWLRQPQGMGGDSIRRMGDANAIAREFGIDDDVSL